MTDKNIIGERVKKRRKELNLTQEELAKKMGYQNRSSINNIETGGRQISQKIVEKLADALYISPSYLMGWDKYLPNNDENHDLDYRDTNPLDISQIKTPKKFDAQVNADANDLEMIRIFCKFLESCNWIITKIIKKDTGETFYRISNNNGAAIELTVKELSLLQDEICNFTDNTIIELFKTKLGL